MPVYEYVCGKCGQTTEAIRPMRDADEPLACEKCGSGKTARKQSVFMTQAARPSGGSGGGPGPSMGGGGCGAGCGCHPH